MKPDCQSESFQNHTAYFGIFIPVPLTDHRDAGSFGNPDVGNPEIAEGCNRMVERSQGHMGHIDEILRKRIVGGKRSGEYYFRVRKFLENNLVIAKHQPPQIKRGSDNLAVLVGRHLTIDFAAGDPSLTVG